MILVSNPKRTVMQVGRAHWHILDAEKGPCSPLWFLSLGPSTDKTDEGWICLLQTVWTGKQMSSPRAVDLNRCPAGDPADVPPRGGPQILGYIPGVWTVMPAVGWSFHCASLLQLWSLGTFMALFTCLSFDSFRTGSATPAFHMFLQSEDMAASSQYLLNACFGWDCPIPCFVVVVVYFIFYISQILRLSVAEMINIHKSQSGGSWTSVRTESWEYSAQGHGVCSTRSWAELLRSGHCSVCQYGVSISRSFLFIFIFLRIWKNVKILM